MLLGLDCLSCCFGLQLLGLLLTGLHSDLLLYVHMLLFVVLPVNCLYTCMLYVFTCTRLDPYLVTMLGRGDQHT
ncbi:hypothetical protein HanRHA438_Chr12g0551681 [Helianthus annuus]|nr:hypothetical protein HanIR_Chr15g0762571 [Helianthus annuus]KAJ0866428.1 hypothetical protein HanRHA438_Chr12g0551681 [Helianthus annuus]